MCCLPSSCTLTRYQRVIHSTRQRCHHARIRHGARHRNLDWLNLFLMTRTKLASVGFVAARNCMRQQVLDDAKVCLTVAGRSPATTCKLPTHQTAPSTTFCKYVMIIHQWTTSENSKRACNMHCIRFVFWILVSACSWHCLSHIMEPTGCSTYLLQQPLWKSCTRSSGKCKHKQDSKKERKPFKRRRLELPLSKWSQIAPRNKFDKSSCGRFAAGEHTALV